MQASEPLLKQNSLQFAKMEVFYSIVTYLSLEEHSVYFYFMKTASGNKKESACYQQKKNKDPFKVKLKIQVKLKH